MDKKVKWGIVILVGAGLIGWGIYSRLPKANEEVAAADKVMTGKQINKRVLNVNAKIIKPQLLTDQIQISGSLMPKTVCSAKMLCSNGMPSVRKLTSR